jgi:hypothetical protein
MNPQRRYPLIVYLHGGPQGFDGDWFDTGLENQIFPAAGYAVLRVNYRGSTSYGEAFCRSLWGDWHWREHDDIMASVDEALAVVDHCGRRDRRLVAMAAYQDGWVAAIHRFVVGIPERFVITTRPASANQHSLRVQSTGSPRARRRVPAPPEPIALRPRRRRPDLDDKDGRTVRPAGPQLPAPSPGRTDVAWSIRASRTPWRSWTFASWTAAGSPAVRPDLCEARMRPRRAHSRRRWFRTSNDRRALRARGVSPADLAEFTLLVGLPSVARPRVVDVEHVHDSQPAERMVPASYSKHLARRRQAFAARAARGATDRPGECVASSGAPVSPSSWVRRRWWSGA